MKEIENIIAKLFELDGFKNSLNEEEHKNTPKRIAKMLRNELCKSCFIDFNLAYNSPRAVPKSVPTSFIFSKISSLSFSSIDSIFSSNKFVSSQPP